MLNKLQFSYLPYFGSHDLSPFSTRCLFFFFIYLIFFQFVLFGVEILKLVPGRVSTEVDARSVNLSYNKSRGIQTVQTCLTLSSPGFKRQVFLHCSSLHYTILFGRPQIYQVNACLQIANSNKCTVGGFRR